MVIRQCAGASTGLLRGNLTKWMRIYAFSVPDIAYRLVRTRNWPLGLRIDAVVYLSLRISSSARAVGHRLRRQSSSRRVVFPYQTGGVPQAHLIRRQQSCAWSEREFRLAAMSRNRDEVYLTLDAVRIARVIEVHHPSFSLPRVPGAQLERDRDGRRSSSPLPVRLARPRQPADRSLRS